MSLRDCTAVGVENGIFAKGTHVLASPITMEGIDGKEVIYESAGDDAPTDFAQGRVFLPSFGLYPLGLGVEFCTAIQASHVAGAGPGVESSHRLVQLPCGLVAGRRGRMAATALALGLGERALHGRDVLE